MPSLWFWLGLAEGVALTLIVAIFWLRRTTRRIRRLERRALAAERLAELGTLTGGLAHEIKNPLSTLNLNVQLLGEDLHEITAALPEQSPERERLGRTQRRLDALTREVRRLRDILEDFLRFAGRMKLDLGPIDANAVLAELVDFYAPQAAAGLRIRTQLDAQPATVNADAALLKQAMLNLFINATQAMAEARQKGAPHGGCDELIIRSNRVRAPEGEEVQLHVIDCGPGVPAGVREKIFQPYFSTKKQGTGLGLPTARRIIEEHGGSLSVQSEVGKGSDFVVALPAAK